MDKPLNILLLEDNPFDAELLQKQLKRSKISFVIDVVDTKEEFEKSLNHNQPDIVLSDHSLPSFNSIEALRLLREKGIDIPFILVTGTVSEEFAVQCMKEGADDYILKSSLTRLPASMEINLASRKIKREKQIIEMLHAKLQDAYSEIEQMHRDITDSINYAQRIQNAMLPQKELLEKHIPDSFIIYKPKDIVSGDFYWMNEVDDKLVIVISDCTGHGVPGALMSMIGNNLLNQIVITRKITRPEEILKELNTGVRKLLRQDMAGIQTQDGMEIAVCTVDKKNQALEFAGARQHLFYSSGKELQMIKGDRKSVGGFQRDPDRVYTNHKIQYEKGDAIYMFSDGYADQFGGKEERRMQTKNLISLLQSNLSNPMGEQERFLDEWLTEWKGKLKQTDDILLVGIRF
jgi:serine phosphatase RsbU (regulator of sigma subunit)